MLVVEADRNCRTLLTPDVPHAAVSVPHVGDVEERLELLRHRELVPRYLSESEQAWSRMRDQLWSGRHTKAVVKDLWGARGHPW